MIDNIREKFYKETFANIEDKKRKRIMKTAISQFAKSGYSASSINHIAKEAGISIGSMYSYFETKEDLFLQVIDMGNTILLRVLDEIKSVEGDIFNILKELLKISIKYSKTHKELVQIYLSASTEELSFLSKRLTNRLESDFVKFYISLIDTAKEKNEIRKDIDTRIAAFYIDNLVVMLQLSFSTSYHSIRLNNYLGQNINNNDLVEKIIKMIRRSIK